jgi:hypothetical protein
MRGLTLLFYGAVTFLLGAIAYGNIAGSLVLSGDPYWQTIADFCRLVMWGGPIVFGGLGVILLIEAAANNARNTQRDIDMKTGWKP